MLATKLPLRGEKRYILAQESKGTYGAMRQRPRLCRGPSHDTAYSGATPCVALVYFYLLMHRRGWPLPS